MLEWLSSSQGFRVEVDGSRVGVVEEVLYGAERHVPAALVVRGGLFGTRVHLVPVENVVSVNPQSKRIAIQERPTETR